MPFTGFSKRLWGFVKILFLLNFRFKIFYKITGKRNKDSDKAYDQSFCINDNNNERPPPASIKRG